MELSATQKARFLQRITQNTDTDVCWPWNGKAIVQGYGVCSINGKQYRAHRLMYILTYNDPGKLLVRHTCDNRLCCNPYHLICGTAQNNTQDMLDRGRHASLQHISIEMLRAIRILAKHGYNATTIARLFHIGVHTVSNILTEHTHKQVL